MRRINPPARGQEEDVVLEALNLYTDRLMTLPHVVGVGMREEKHGRYVVAVYVDRPPADDGPQEERIPASLPLEREKAKQPVRVPTLIEQVGAFELERQPYKPNRVGADAPRAEQVSCAQALRAGGVRLRAAVAALPITRIVKASMV